MCNALGSHEGSMTSSMSMAKFWAFFVAVAAYQYWRWTKEKKRPPEIEAVLEGAKRIRKLQKTDPAAAERLAKSVFEQFERDREQRREALRVSAATDPSAMRALRAELAADLDAIRSTQRGPRWALGATPLPNDERVALERDARTLESEIAALDRRAGKS